MPPPLQYSPNHIDKREEIVNILMNFKLQWNGGHCILKNCKERNKQTDIFV